MAKVGDLEQHVWSRMVVVSHVWPGITPFNVWWLPLDVWLMYAQAADQWSEERRREASGGR